MMSDGRPAQLTEIEFQKLKRAIQIADQGVKQPEAVAFGTSNKNKDTMLRYLAYAGAALPEKVLLRARS